MWKMWKCEDVEFENEAVGTRQMERQTAAGECEECGNMEM
jgi:hypothetical protein